MMNNESKIISIENYDLIRKENQSKYIKSITQIKYTRIPNKKTKILVIGPISAGKSSLLNRFLNTKLEVGVGQTTVKISPVFTTNDNIEVYDSPGINKDYDICDYRILNDLFTMSIFLVCFQNCLSEVNVIIRILSAIRFKFGQKIYLVRTQCDRFDQSDLRTLS